MSLRSAAFASLALAACQSAPPPDSPSNQQVLHELAQARVAVDTQVSLLTTLFAGRSTDPLHEGVESAGTTELNGRLAILSRQLDELLARLPAATATNATEAAARRNPSPEPAEAAVALLQQAMSVTEQLRNVILENIANVNTAGWKKRQLQISTTLHQASGLQMPTAATIETVWTTGTLEITERNLDVAIDGDGLFAVTAADGTTNYTRNGGFHLNADGKLVTADGLVVVPEITVPSDTLEIAIDPEGRVTGRTAGAPDTSTSFGQLMLSRFVNPSGLVATRNGAMRCTDASGYPITGAPGSTGLGLLKQGFLERSNVQVMNELINLQMVERQRTLLRRVLADYGLFVR
jgi:flagellar basal-body rod protein FlgG